MLGDFTSAAILEMRFRIPNEMVASKNPSERSSTVDFPACFSHMVLFSCAAIFPYSYPLIRKHTCAYHEASNVIFSENFAYVLNE